MCAVYMILVGGRQRYFDDEDHWSDGRERRRDDFHGLQDPARFFSIRRDFKERNWSTVVIKNRSVYMTQDRLLSCCSLWTQLWVCPEGSWNVDVSYTRLGTHLPSSPASSSLAASIHEMPPLEAWLSCTGVTLSGVGEGRLGHGLKRGCNCHEGQEVHSWSAAGVSTSPLLIFQTLLQQRSRLYDMPSGYQ